MAKGEPHPLTGHLPPDRPPLGRRTFAHWPHTAGSHSLVKRGATLTAPPGRRAFAYWPPLATASPTGHPLATKGRERNFVRPSLTYGAPAPTGHLREPKTDLAKWRLWPPTPPPPTPADRGLRTGRGQKQASTPPTGLREGAGGFRVQRVPMRCCPR